MELMPMTYFILESTQKLRYNDDCEFAYVVRKYANFLKQPLTLGMFVPTDEDGNILEDVGLIPSKEQLSYRQAKERVLFKGFDVEINTKGYSVQFLNKTTNVRVVFWSKNKIIENTEKTKTIYFVEDLIGFNIELTESAIKQLGL